MKKIGILLIMLMTITGCSMKKHFETIADVWDQPQLPQASQVVMDLPENAAVAVMQGRTGIYYQCDGYELMVETMVSGDLKRTVHTISGYDSDDLTLIQTETPYGSRSQLTWCAAGEDGDQVVRSTILDDGTYHYVVSTMAGAKQAAELQSVWNKLHASVGLKKA